MRIVVFDFDKTIVVNDSLTQLFLREAFKKPVVMLFYLFLVTLYKLRLLSNGTLKLVMFKLLFKSEQDLLESIGNITFSQTQVLDILIYHLEKGDSCIISTASLDLIVENFKDFFNLKYNNLIISASNVNFSGDRIFLRNNYGKSKVENLLILGIQDYDILFTDDLRSDKYLANQANMVVKVDGNRIKVL